MRPDRKGEHRTAFEKNRQIILATQEICGICGQPVGRDFKNPHPLSATVDHIIPVAKGGHPSDLANLQLAHRWCNRWKSDRLVNTTFEFEAGAENDAPLDLPQHYDWAKYKA